MPRAEWRREGEPMKTWQQTSQNWAEACMGRLAVPVSDNTLPLAHGVVVVKGVREGSWARRGQENISRGKKDLSSYRHSVKSSSVSSACFGQMVHGWMLHGAWCTAGCRMLRGAWCTAGCYMVHGARLDATINIWPKANVTTIEKNFWVWE